MSPTHSTAQDTASAVAVLQAQQQSLDGAIRDLTKTMAEGFAGMNVKMDRVNELGTVVAQLSVRQESHSDSLTRAFASMENLTLEAKKHAEEERAYRAESADQLDARFASRDRDIGEIVRKIAHARGWVIGFGTLMAGCMAIMFWVANLFIDQIHTNTNELRALQIQNANAINITRP